MLSFADMFAPYLGDETLEKFNGAKILNYNLDATTHTFNADIKSEIYINHNDISYVKSVLKEKIGLSSIKFDIKFSSDCFDENSLKDTVEELKLKNTSVNGYLNDAVYNVSSDDVKITLAHGGYKSISECGFAEKVAAGIKERFSTEINIVFDGQLENIDIKIPETIPDKTDKPEKVK